MEYCVDGRTMGEVLEDQLFGIRKSHFINMKYLPIPSKSYLHGKVAYGRGFRSKSCATFICSTRPSLLMNVSGHTLQP